MRNLHLAEITCAVSILSAASASAAPAAASTYDLQRMLSKTPVGFVWTVHAAPKNARSAPAAPGGMYRTLDAPALRTWAAHLPAHSVIRFSSVAMPVPHPDPSVRPDTTFWAQLKSFDQLCEKHQVSFRPELHTF